MYRTAVRKLSEFAHEHGVKVIDEGVESAAARHRSLVFAGLPLRKAGYLYFAAGVPVIFKFRNCPVSKNEPSPTLPYFSERSIPRSAPLVFPLA